MSSEAFVIERVYSAPIQRVWEAITDPEKMKQWYFNIPGFKPEVGFQFQFEGGPDGRTYLHRCEVVEVIPGRKLKHSWRYEGYPGNSFVTWELIEEGDKTRVRLTHEGLETFPVDNPDLARHNFETGWNSIVGNSLPAYLQKVTVPKA